MVEDLCASGNDMYYTKLMNNTNWQWEVNTYKVTRWLSDGEMIFLGDREKSHNVVEVIWTPGHTPDSLILWFAHENRLFIGDQFYRFEDIMLTYNHTDIKDYEASLKKILNFIMKQPQPKQIRYSASRSDSDFLCLPILKQYHRFFLNILAGTQIGSPLQVNEGDGWRYENRDKSMRVIISSDIVERLNRAREKALQYH
ncbi:hypothetical protein DICVIV_10567 [Dictyocaulus viviparus]|uniref:Metallo-beta-lactamase domain-containing protein n=1 Tax=Dictyocaulus viviparus TaxID=29172 RepID=A0A0D8XI16_DICVI|nr:hypothetical protein DICVIV_10567 [Dictyocaulus viviparus]